MILNNLNIKLNTNYLYQTTNLVIQQKRLKKN